MGLTYALITPARNEAVDLPRLAQSLGAQSQLPVEWVIVDHGSTDATAEIAAELAAENDWVHPVAVPGEAVPTRGGPIVQAFSAGLDALAGTPDIVVKLDADVSFEPDHFSQLVAEFANDPTLGIASGTCYEFEDGTWVAKLTARSHVRGAVRAYRRQCLEDVTPLEQRFGWDTIDELKAQLHGWSTRTIAEIGFFHHRTTGARDGSRRNWEAQGQLAWYLQYRLPYLLARTAFRSVHDWHALAMLPAWASAAARREPRYRDADVRRLLRDQQRLLRFTERRREVTDRPSRRG